MSDTLFPVKPEIAASAHVTAEQLAAMHARLAADPDRFWLEQSYRVAWTRPPTKTVSGDFSGDVRVNFN